MVNLLRALNCTAMYTCQYYSLLSGANNELICKQRPSAALVGINIASKMNTDAFAVMNCCNYQRL